MKKNTFIFLSFILLAANAFAQQFGNEWINYNQQYAKFKIFATGMYRIPYSQLSSVGFPATVQGNNLQLFRDGKEIPLFVSNNGTLSPTDYIEFYGEKATGYLDSFLYKTPQDQLNPSQCLLYDTAFYFVTYNNSTTNLRYAPQANTIVSPPPVEPYFWDKINRNFRGAFLSGESYFGQFVTPIIYLNSSLYEEGEGFTKNLTDAPDTIANNLLFPYTVSGGPNASLKTTVDGYSYITNHRVQIKANGNIMADSTFGAFKTKKFNLSIPLSYLTPSNTLEIKYTPLNTVASANIFDRVGIATYELRYPRLFNFNNVSSYYFELDPKLTSYYLEITNFNAGAVAPRLYDMSSQTYYTADITIAGMYRFLLPPSSQIKKLLLVSQSNPSIFNSISNLMPITFKNYTLPSNQGNYVIISHQKLFNDGSGNNYVDQYKNYRASANGGAYTPIVAEISDIYNEFGYGYTFHPLSIRNFLKYTVQSTNWSTPAKYAFIICKGLSYTDYTGYATSVAIDPNTYPFNVIPTFGTPGSDPLLTDFGNNNLPQLSIGRLSAMNTTDVKNYLSKVKEYELSLYNTAHQYSDSVQWKKKLLHIAGTNNISEQIPIVTALDYQKSIIEDTLYGGHVTLVKKSSTGAVEQANSAIIDNLINTGVSIVQFYGHSSASTLDYNLDDPTTYSNQGKYPIFIANGCSVGNMFLKYAQKTIGEKWVTAANSGSIAFIASDNTGITSPLATYTNSLYRKIGVTQYGGTIGDQLKQNINDLVSFAPTDTLLRVHTEQILLQGDPALRTYFSALPDYAIEDKGIRVLQNSITTNMDSFNVQVVFHNLGKYQLDSFTFKIKRTYPNNSIQYIYTKQYVGLAYSDTLNLRIAVDGANALGNNTFEFILDEELKYPEISELNNSVKKIIGIYNDDLVPVYPYEFSIVSQQGVYLKASTLNPFSPERKYLFQLDTTETFDSPLLTTTNVISKGGVIKWQPPVAYNDHVVYYWRTAMDTLYGNHIHRWTTSSFIFITGSLPGWNQSHYYQYLKDRYTDLRVDSGRKFSFLGINKHLHIQNACLFGPSPYNYGPGDYVVKINGAKIYEFGCEQWPYNSAIQFMIIDTLTGLPIKNTLQTGTGYYLGKYGSNYPCQPGNIDDKFQFDVHTPLQRKKAMDFIDSIPNGYYVMMMPFLNVGSAGGPVNSVFINQWKADTTLFGSGKSLYHKVKNLGFSKIDSFYKNRPMIFFTKKNTIGFVPTQVVESDITKIAVADVDYTNYIIEGQMISTKIGPAKLWNSYLRDGHSLDGTLLGDTVSTDIYGIAPNGTETFITNVLGDTSLTFIDAVQYPCLRLVMKNRDTIFATPEQVNYWRVHYQPVPEAALNPLRHFVFLDTLGQGQQTTAEICIENLTEIPMDSMLVKFDLIDKNNNRSTYAMQRLRPLAGLDTVIAHVDINSTPLDGNLNIVIEANPNNDQPEQYHPNNIGYKPLYVIGDKKNPLIDVTFDGIHILNKDIVSSKPFINISLRDENKFLALNDTSLIDVFLRLPGDAPTIERRIPFDGTELKFIAADANVISSNNTARIEYRPTFTEDGSEYLLIVKAKDRTGNNAGNLSYKIGFTIITKPSISSFVNYPNPFSTSTQFVYTLTGSEVPSNIKIQIMNIAGKIVREITKDELGLIHIGKNISEYKWKGDDQYGQLLGNGVYLYRVVSNLKGSNMDHYQSGADKWIEKGFGKLYIMR